MHGNLAAGTAALTPVSWRRAFGKMADKRRKREQTNFRLMAYVALTAAVSPLFPVALHAIFRF